MDQRTGKIIKTQTVEQGRGQEIEVHAGWVVFAVIVGLNKGDIIVIEKPRIYPKAPQRQSDIIELSYFTGLIVGGIHFDVHNRPKTPSPFEWKGNVKKDVHNARVVRLLGLQDKKLNDHEIDACGLALFGFTGKRV